MRVGNFSVLVPEGTERETGHVALEHGRQYTVRLMSHDNRQCDAEVTIDGKDIGTFRLHGYGSMTLERMPSDNGRFTFYTSGTSDASAAGDANIGTQDKGLVQVKFIPEKAKEWVWRKGGPGGRSVRPMGMAEPYKETWNAGGSVGTSYSTGITRSTEELTAGITGLSGHSDQQFVDVGGIIREESDAVQISLRLVASAAGPRELKAAPRSNPVPVPVG